MDKLIVLLIALIIIFCIVYFKDILVQGCPPCPVCPSVTQPNISLILPEYGQINDNTRGLSMSNFVRQETPKSNWIDPVREYDYKKVYDPLEEPTRRVSRHELPPFYFKRMIDYPTRGYPDNFNQIGVLTREGLSHSSNNSIIRLFSRQTYPGSDRYEYYTMINNGFDQIKIPIDSHHNQELYDDDIIFIKELNDKYKVNLHKYDQPRYYPDIF